MRKPDEAGSKAHDDAKKPNSPDTAATSELGKDALDKVTGGLSEITVTKHVDKPSTPIMN
jgi:hypothetical protein